ncbi:calcium homeostasis modulator protein-like, partial [Stegodyphus dumicola]|uniref:calcium homeostasis modulator protein-like n=1 Tax=Stegodyphus dumicola TaxID=202533 RepID=UPI0015A829A2
MSAISPILGGLSSFLQNHQVSFTNGVLIVFTIGGEKIFRFASFKCPCQQPLASVYGSSFMIGPAVIIGVIGILVNNLTWRLCHGCMYRSPRSRHGVPETIRQCSSIFARSCVVPSAWLFVTLLDGNYYVCLASTAPCETESEENKRLVATSQIISWIFLVTTVAIATLG